MNLLNNFMGLKRLEIWFYANIGKWEGYKFQKFLYKLNLISLYRRNWNLQIGEGDWGQRKIDFLLIAGVGVEFRKWS